MRHPSLSLRVGKGNGLIIVISIWLLGCVVDADVLFVLCGKV